MGILLALCAVAQSEEFEVRHYAATLEEAPLVVLERPEYARLVAPYFKANATVRCAVRDDHTVGFIQQVDSMEIRNEYARATTSWELPRLPAYDRASESSPPWYGTLHEIRRVRGGSSGIDVEVAMDDNLVSSVTWREPLPGGGVGEKPELSAVRRKQTFTTWLVARRDSDGRITVLRKATWGIEFEVAVDVAKPLGARCRIAKSPVRPPVISDGRDETIQEQCLKGRGANDAQEFWWTPKREGIGSRTRLRP